MGEPAVLLLHGQPGSADDWGRVRAALAGRAHTIAIERPGWNGRGRPLGLVGNAQAAVAALDASGAAQATVVGHSLGAAVAAWLAADQPERVRALVLAAPSVTVASLNRLDHLLAAPLIGPLLAAAALAGTGTSLRSTVVRERLAAELGLEERYLRGVAQVFLRPASWRAFVSEQRMLIRELPALERRLPSLSAPTIVVSGSADRIVTPSSARQLVAQIPNAEFVQLSGASHLLPQQRPDELAEVIVRATS